MSASFFYRKKATPISIMGIVHVKGRLIRGASRNCRIEGRGDCNGRADGQRHPTGAVGGASGLAPRELSAEAAGAAAVVVGRPTVEGSAVGAGAGGPSRQHSSSAFSGEQSSGT